MNGSALRFAERPAGKPASRRWRGPGMAALAAVLAAGAGGCATTAVPPREPPPTEQRFDAERSGLEAGTLADGAGAETAAGGDLPQRILIGTDLHGDWWQVFHSGRLDALVAQALHANPTVREAIARLAAAEAWVQVAEGAGGPQASLEAGAGREKYGAQFLGTLPKPPPFGYFAAGPAVSYQIDLAGGESHGVARQRALAAVERNRLTAARLALSGEVVSEVLRCATLDQQLDTVADLLARDQEALRLTGAAVQLGALAPTAVAPAEAVLASDQQRLPPLRSARARARHALAVLFGQGAGEPLPPLPSLAELELPARIPVSLPSALAHRRPDVLAAEAQLDAAAQALGVADAGLYPQLTLSASGGLQSTDPGHFFNPASTVFSLAAAFSAPLWDGGRLRAGQRAAAADLQASSAWYQHTVLQAFGQVADALSTLDQDGAALAASAQSWAAAASSADAARRAQRAGSGTLPEQVDAERTLLRTELAWQQAAARRYLDTAQLLLALGGSGEETFAP